MAPDPAFAFVEGPCCPTLDFVCVFWTMVTFNTLLLRHFIFNENLVVSLPGKTCVACLLLISFEKLLHHLKYHHGKKVYNYNFLSEFSSVQVYHNDNAYSNMMNYMKDETLL